MDWAIKVEGVGKDYEIRHQRGQGNPSLRETLSDAVRNRVTRAGRAAARASTRERFAALADVNFEVARGERVGIIGRNGAGKSTLLKVLSRITPPSRGRVRLRGRVASLLEVGTGFHPELTGRENVYLNGAILGMSRAEIARKFDEIVAFAEVERFLDTPVKRYSSGMHVRLAFAVAAHLESEILIVDEVLAVGDAEFQARCLSRMQSISEGGRTVLFVSHNLPAVQRLCTTGILLSAGRVSACGPVAGVLNDYEGKVAGAGAAPAEVAAAPGEARFTGWRLESSAAALPHACYSRETCRLAFSIHARRTIESPYYGFALWSVDGQLILAGSSADGGGSATLREGRHELIVETRLPIKAGTYRIDVSLNAAGEGQIDRWHAEPALVVLPAGGSSLPERWHGTLNEIVRFAVPGSPTGQRA